jgi:hypothetical protein
VAGSEPEPGAAHRRLALAAGVIGGAGIVLGIVAGSVALIKKGARDDACGGTFPDCTERVRESEINGAQRAMWTAGTLSTIGFISGAALLALGATLYLVAPTRSRGALSSHVVATW